MLKRRRPSRNSWPSSGPVDAVETPADPAALSGKAGRGREGQPAKPASALNPGGAAMLRVQAMIGNRAAADLVIAARHEQLFERLKLDLPAKDDEDDVPVGIVAEQRHTAAVAYVDEYFEKLVAIGDLIGDSARRAGFNHLQASGRMPDNWSRDGLDLFIAALSKTPGAGPLLALLATMTRGGARMRRLLLRARKRGGQADQRHLQFQPVETLDALSGKTFRQMLPVRDHLEERLGELRDERHPNPKQVVREYLEDTFGRLPELSDAKSVLDQAADAFELMQYRRFYTRRAGRTGKVDRRVVKGMPYAVRRRIVKLSGKSSLAEALEEWELTDRR